MGMFLCFTGHGLARLGETVEQLDQRYGKPLKTEDFGGFSTRTYEKGNYSITATLADGKSVVEIFSKRGMTDDDANQVLALIAGPDAFHLNQEKENAIRGIIGLSHSDQVWSWRKDNPDLQRGVSFNPIEGRMIFFVDPKTCGEVQRSNEAAADSRIARPHR